MLIGASASDLMSKTPAAAFAMAELIDNALSATQHNAAAGRKREIVISIYLDYGPEKKNYIIVRDNGKGMSNVTLETWATYHKVE